MTTTLPAPEVQDAPAPAPARAATRADVARAAGVSTAVVSYVVNEGPRRVAPHTAARVRAAIAALAYSPNVAARSLRKGSSEMVGLVVPDIGNPYFAELARAVEVAASEQGLLVALASSQADGDVERELMAELSSRNVDGLLVSTVRPPEHLPPPPPGHRPTVLVNASRPYPGYAAIGADAAQGAYDVVDHLLGVHGHTSVALVIGASTERLPEPREEGFANAFAAHGLPPGPVVRTVFSRTGGYEALRRILSWRHRPGAVFLSSDEQASGAYRAVREAGLECPEDIALVAYDGTSHSEFSWPPMTVSRQPIAAMARAALATVLGSSPVGNHQEFATELVVRRSCGCP
ncbi:transcriptional regulator, LacI family [Microlunatus sagamiharensis]|uniref:Transcriptional regulator, LacI family n=1 Tax=Microlunatus sagamiharensis TaxID=546874 RepID=A0A1H2MRJ8_9ACTN|nr:LacI family DNA-binding transcriptional regulator [Microlunatus sagamiharensis]SDU95714.1 transcriptional regulator, LacI family [Microlunatus sagamiharensis]